MCKRFLLHLVLYVKKKWTTTREKNMEHLLQVKKRGVLQVENINYYK
jgi:hypothetical protein